jgi:flagellum-specific peptidoglycan hydrolase FlgJ
MPSASKPWWQQVTALVSLGAGGAVTGFSFVPRPAADLTSPASLPVHLMALEQSARPAAADDGTLRSAIVNVASYYRRMAESKTPAEMEAIIWQHDSMDGADHGSSCAAFASLTLELGAHVTGQQSWVSGGSSYPWPLHDWVDARVNPNPASPGITSIVQDAEAHHRWHAVGDGYQPLPGDWVVFSGHVEVVTKYAGGVLSTIGGDSLPNFSVNAHDYPGSLASQGVVGFVNNGALPAVADKVLPGGTAAPAGQQAKKKAEGTQRQAAGSRPAAPAGLPVAAAPAMATDTAGAMADTTVIPGLPIMAHRLRPGPKAPAAHYKRHNPAPAPAPVHDVSSQQAFIGEIAPGAIAAQRKYGVPASVTIAQAIDESGWGQSTLATKDHNLFGIKGTGPAGSDPLPTHEYQNGQLVAATSSFRVYNNTSESIEDHGKLLATSGYYGKSMADRRNPNAFAQALTGIYATDPSYGTQLISLMRQYNLYRYDVTSPAPKAAPPAPVAATSPVAVTSPVAATIPGLPVAAPTAPPRTAPPSPAPTPSGSPAAGNGAGSQQPRPNPVPSGPTPAAPGPSAAPTATPASMAPSAAPSAGTSAGPTPSAAPSGRMPSGRPSAAPSAASSPSGRPSAAPSAASSPSGTPSARASAGPAQTAASSGPASSGPAPSGPAPSGPASSGPAPSGPAPSGPASSGPASSAPTPAGQAPSGGPSPAASAGPVAAAAPSRPAPSARPAPAASAEPTPSAAPSGPAPSAQPSSARSPAVPGLPVAARAPTGSEPSAQVPASAPQAAAAVPYAAAPAALTVYAGRRGAPARRRARRNATGHAYKPAGRYHQHMPPAVRNAFVGSARGPLLRAEPLYQDVASHSGISWELLAACDWMQCEARARYSPVHGERLGTVNQDGTRYHTKSEALEQCAEDLVELAETVYGIDLTAPAPLSVRDLANAFAAFRWGGLLRLHRTSAMEFPYSVAGLTPQHTRMRWPNIADPNTPDKPGGRFRKPFGAVPIVLALNYPATV